MKIITLKNSTGDCVELLTFGARIKSWTLALGNETRNIVLGYDKVEDYLTDPFFHGALVGPFANRIGGASFCIDGQQYDLPANEGNNLLHGGDGGLHQINWQVADQDEQSVVLKAILDDGHDGFPGNRTFKVSYTLLEDGSLRIDMLAETDKPTVIGLTSHPYFNLQSAKLQSIEGHKLQIAASQMTENDAENIPTGAFIPVKNGLYDFAKLNDLTEQNTAKLDNNFCLSEDAQVKALLVSKDNKLLLSVETDLPGMQVYTGFALEFPFTARQGICLEPQYFPDCPNNKNFPFELTTKEKPFNHSILYKVEKQNSSAI